MCLIIGTPKIIKFLIVPNGELFLAFLNADTLQIYIIWYMSEKSLFRQLEAINWPVHV